ncbi:MAG: hypothetical protein ABFD08_00135 [Syntrophomonas sp.]
MQINASKKRIWLCLLICSLFAASYLGIFSTDNVFSSDLYAMNSSSASPGAEHPAMSGGTSLWHIHYLAITNITTEFFGSSPKLAQWLFTKTILNILTSLITALTICLIFSSRLAGSLCSQFSSIAIISFLHKKDGMK